MLDPIIRQIVSQIHSTPQKVVFEFSGAGSLALFWLHSVGGSSRTMLEAIDHYSSSSTVALLGYEPEQFVTPKTAREMARRAYQRGLRLSSGSDPVIGIGCTATISTDYTKRGEHHCQLAICQHGLLTRYAVTFLKGKRDRMAEETLVSRIVLNSLAQACGIHISLDLGLDGTERMLKFNEDPSDPLEQLLQATVKTVTINPNGRMVVDHPLSDLSILSGSFNPLHDGHTRLADAAAKALRIPVVFELPVINADKAPISYLEICRRFRQFSDTDTLILTRSPLFHHKSKLFPNSVFVIGFDTAIRLLDPHYYGGDKSSLHAAFDTISAAGCHFLVTGRLWQGKYHCLRDLEIHPKYERLFKSLSEDKFRLDVASTTLRKNNGVSDQSQA